MIGRQDNVLRLVFWTYSGPCSLCCCTVAYRIIAWYLYLLRTTSSKQCFTAELCLLYVLFSLVQKAETSQQCIDQSGSKTASS